VTAVEVLFQPRITLFSCIVFHVTIEFKGYTLTWSQNGVQQSGGVRQPIGIATSRVAQLPQLLFI